MAERPTKEIKKKSLAKEATTDLIQGKYIAKDSGKKYKKLIIWDAEMKDILEIESKKRSMTITGFIKYCVAKEINKS